MAAYKFNAYKEKKWKRVLEDVYANEENKIVVGELAAVNDISHKKSKP